MSDMPLYILETRVKRGVELSLERAGPGGRLEF